MSYVIQNKIKKSTYTYEGFPLIRMNSAITQAFFVPTFRAQLTENWMQKHGRQGVGLCNSELRLIAWLRPNGTILELQPPFKVFEMWQMSNAPPVTSSSQQQCACRDYYDPEVGGAWKERGLPAWHHHPFCQFSKSAQKVFKDSADSAYSRIGERMDWDGEKWLPKEGARNFAAPSPQKRPDEWIRRQLEEETD